MQSTRINSKTKLKAIKSYLDGMSVAEITSRFEIHPVTLWRWMKKYKKGGIEYLTRKRDAWNKSPRRIEEKVVALKEMTPSLAVNEACKMLKKQGIRISKNGIWNIWRRYGFTGFIKEKYSHSYQNYIYISPDIKKSVEKIEHMIKAKEIKKAAKLLNSLPVIPEIKTIRLVPEHLLSLRRCVDQLANSFGAIPLSVYWKKVHKLRENLERSGMYYSSLRVGVFEGYALKWLGNSEEVLKLCKHLINKTEGIKDPGIRFTLSLFEAGALAHHLKIKGALKCIKRCKIILKHIPTSYNLMGELAAAYTHIGHYRESMDWAAKAIKGIEKGYRKPMYIGFASLLTTSGKYSEALKFLKKVKPEKTDYYYYSQKLLIEACACLSKGKFQEASSLATEALLKSKKEEVRRHFHTATFILACSYAAVGNKKEAKSYLRKYNSLLKKYHFEREYLMRGILLGNINIPEEALLIPSLRLAYLLYKANKSNKAGDYQKALRYAHSRKLFGFFERLVLFSPESVEQLFRKGKDPGLPKGFSKMPVFNKEIPVYEIKLLGNMIAYKNQKRLPEKLQPKDTAFLIHLALKAGEPNKSISLDNIYRNYWKNSINPSRNLSHLLVRIKKALKIPSHLIEVSYRKGNPVFINKGIHFITDYAEYQTFLAQAKTLLRAGEWGFSKREFMRAFELFRGEPFKKMYDDWSDDKRLEILFSYETEVLSFAKELQKRGSNEEAEKLLKKAERIVPLERD